VTTLIKAAPKKGLKKEKTIKKKKAKKMTPPKKKKTIKERKLRKIHGHFIFIRARNKSEEKIKPKKIATVVEDDQTQ
jgi:hypothetical protein